MAHNLKVNSSKVSSSATSHVGPILEHPLSQKSLVTDPSMVQSLVGRVQSNPAYRQQLLDIVELSKSDPQASRAAANAITILVKAKVRFNSADLRGIRVPGADLSGGQFDSVQFQGADLTGVNLSRTWIRQADFACARLNGVRFEELPIIREPRSVARCAFSPDGKTFATALDLTRSISIKIYDTSTWTVIHNLRGHTDELCSIAYSPCGQKLISGCADRTTRLWDCQTGSLIRIFDFLSPKRWVQAVAYSPKGDQVCTTASNGPVQVFDPDSGALLFSLMDETESIYAVEYSPDGRWLASATWHGIIRFFDLQSGGDPGLVLESSHGWIDSIAFSPDGRRIVAGHDNGVIQVWDTFSGEVDLTMVGAHTRKVENVTFSPDGRWIASGSYDDTAALWDARTGRRVGVFAGHEDSVNSAVFSSDGSLLVTSGGDCAIRRWELSSLLLEAEKARSNRVDNTPEDHFVEVTSVAYSHDGRWIIAGKEDGSVQQFDATTGEAGFLYPSRYMCAEQVAFSPNSPIFASVGFVKDGEDVKVWNAETGMSHAVLSGHDWHVSSVQFSPCGRWIATGGDKDIRLRDVSSEGVLLQELVLKGHKNSVFALAFSKDSRRLVSCSWDDSVRVWDLASVTGGSSRGGGGIVVDSRALFSFTNGGINIRDVAFAPNDREIATCHWEEEVLIWDVSTGKVLHTLKHDFDVGCLKYSSCGEWLATSGHQTVSLWKSTSSSSPEMSTSLRSGEGCREKWAQAITIKGFAGKVREVAWKSGTLELVTGCEDGSVRVWNIVNAAGAGELKDTAADDGEGEGVFSARLVWSSGYPVLMANKALLVDAVGLGDVERLLLKQRGALDETPPLIEENKLEEYPEID